MKKALLLATTTWLYAGQMVIYPNIAYIEETFKVEDGTIAPLPRTIIRDSIRLGCDTQAYRFIKAQTPEDLVKKSLKKGQKIAFFHQKKRLTGTILSVDPLLIKADRIYWDVRYKDLVLKSFPLAPLQSQLQLVGGDASVCDVGFLAGGIRWYSAYVAVLDGKLELEGNIHIQNESGRDYENMRLAVVAGELKRRRLTPRAVTAAIGVDTIEAAPVKHKEVMGYHRYDLRGRWDLKDRQELVVRYVHERLAYRHYLRLRSDDLRYNFGTRTYRFNQVVEFKAPKALPRGVVRFFAQGSFIGENYMPQSAKGEGVHLIIGKDFDLRLKKEVLAFFEDRHSIETTLRYTITNPKGKSVEISIEEDLGSNWRAKSGKPYKKLDARTIAYELKIPAKSKLSFTATYQFFK
ncbi:MAG: hypothetical protein C6I00_03320 [Nitratiruptor sp.]|nr:hypothetical protein [Nitratiruptor sp.]NPA83129.1 hypothetical protein [Campylobacterota bacterium]